MTDSPSKEKWLARYKQRFIDAGLTAEEAQECANCVELTDDLSDSPSVADDPEAAADDEMSYWDNDGDGE